MVPVHPKYSDLFLIVPIWECRGFLRQVITRWFPAQRRGIGLSTDLLFVPTMTRLSASILSSRSVRMYAQVGERGIGVVRVGLGW